VADLVDRYDAEWGLGDQGPVSIAPTVSGTFTGVAGEIWPSPLALDMADDELLAENTRLLEEIRVLKLHLNLVHDCDWRQ
jgi:hypothetical protein